ncbi:hypothetical protein ACFFGX_21380 [Azorhizophilus paspali]|uniref:Uncharacterized protein n=1 Tax=Azorhizophilus paspali TaxID=69963 RepID=A0ABV6SUJ7_AZOPA
MPIICEPRNQPARASPTKTSCCMNTTFSETSRHGMHRPIARAGRISSSGCSNSGRSWNSPPDCSTSIPHGGLASSRAVVWAPATRAISSGEACRLRA